MSAKTKKTSSAPSPGSDAARHLHTNQVGAAAEALVRYRLMSWGYDVHDTTSISTYDLIVEHPDIPHLARLQVKGTSRPTGRKRAQNHAPYYIFNTKKKGADSHYTADTLDIMALVALDIEKILYVPAPITVTSLRVRRDTLLAPGTEHQSWLDAIAKITNS